MNNDIPKFQEQDITIKYSDHQDTVPAIIHQYCPGLAVTMSCFGIFTITHVETGLSLSSAYERAFTAFLDLTKFDSVAKQNQFSWESIKTQEEALKTLDSIWDKPVPFDGATITHNGVTKPLSIKDWLMSLRIYGDLYSEYPFSERDTLGDAYDNIRKTQNKNA